MDNRIIGIIHFRMSAIAIGFICGILFGSYNLVIGGIISAVSICIILLSFFPRFKNLYLLFLLFFIIGILRVSAYREIAVNDISNLAQSNSRFIGFIASDPELREDKTSFIFNAKEAFIRGEYHRVCGRVLISIYKDKIKQFNGDYGDKLEIISFIKEPQQATNPNAFSYKDYLRRQGIYCTASISEPRNIKILNENHSNSITKLAYKIKHSISRSCERIYSKETAPLIIGMALGSYTSISPDTYDAFTRTGTLHLLAASGFNCFIIAFYSNLFFTLLRLKPLWRCIGIIFLLFIYLLIIGPKPSILRAAIMASLAILARPISRAADLKNLFFCALIIVLMINPTNIFDVGFQLSFMGVAALIFFHRILRSLVLSIIRKKKRYGSRKWVSIVFRKTLHLVFETAIGCIAVLIFVSPIIAYDFNYISITSIPANILMSGFAQLIYGFGILAPVFTVVPIIGHIIGNIGSGITSYCLSSLNWLSSWEYSSVSVKSPSIGFIIFYYIALMITLHYLTKKESE